MTSSNDSAPKSTQPTVLSFKKKPISEAAAKLARKQPTKTNSEPSKQSVKKAVNKTAGKTSNKAGQPNTQVNKKSTGVFTGFGKLNLRARVILVLQQVLEGQSLNQVLPHAIEQIPVKDKALFHELVMGSLRHWFALDAQIQPMLTKSLTDHRVQIALILGLYQLMQTRIPAHAAISETVEAIRQLKLDKASGLVNALLRRSTREMQSIQSSFEKHHALPQWLYQQLKNDWNEQADDIAQQLRVAAPLTLRVNSRQCSHDQYLQQLIEAGIEAQACILAADGIQILQSVQVTELPGYTEGWFSVQDEHAQLCAELLGDLTGKRVLDACAAPGGKTAHILEKYQPAVLVALDHDEKRLQRISDNLQRLRLDDQNVHIVHADAAHWTADQPFDVILLDAPCTATGVIRRHPDIKLLRHAEDVAQTVQLQNQLLAHLWSQLNVGGILLYVTCSLLKQENEYQIQEFLTKYSDQAKRVTINAIKGQSTQTELQFFPITGAGDGFYYAKIEKISA